jgi:hypothetical protein
MILDRHLGTFRNLPVGNRPVIAEIQPVSFAPTLVVQPLWWMPHKPTVAYTSPAVEMGGSPPVVFGSEIRLAIRLGRHTPGWALSRSDNAIAAIKA